MNSFMKVVCVGVLLAASGAALIDFDIYWTGGTLQAIGWLVIVCGPIFMEF